MGKSAAILCNGMFPSRKYPRYLLNTADYILCCDGALRTYLRMMPAVFGRTRLPDAVIGDMDSLSPYLQKKYAPLLVRIEEQDDNDQTKAFRYILDHYRDGLETIHILGSTGKRADHTIGNLSLLMEYARTFNLEGIAVDAVSDYGTAFAITDSSSFFVGEGRSISIFTPDNSLEIKSEGLVWQTDGVHFDNWWKATLNRASQDKVTLTFSHPSIALVFLD